MGASEDLGGHLLGASLDSFHGWGTCFESNELLGFCPRGTLHMTQAVLSECSRRRYNNQEVLASDKWSSSVCPATLGMAVHLAEAVSSSVEWRW